MARPTTTNKLKPPSQQNNILLISAAIFPTIEMDDQSSKKRYLIPTLMDHNLRTAKINDCALSTHLKASHNPSDCQLCHFVLPPSFSF